MTRPLRSLLLMLSLVFVSNLPISISAEAQGSIYYVATDGVDAPGRGTSALPWRTIITTTFSKSTTARPTSRCAATCSTIRPAATSMLT